MSALKQRIYEEMKAAFYGGDRFRGDVLRNLKAAILNEEVAQMKRDEGLDDAEVEKVIVREVKKRKESAELYRANNRDDLAEPEEQELAVLEGYLPEQMDDDSLGVVVDEIIATMGAVDMKQMGQVIGAVKAKVGNSADGAKISQIVKQKLSK